MLQQARDNERAVTPRALLLGAALSVLLAIGLPYGGLVVQGSRLGLSTATPAAFFLFFVWMFLVQPVLRLLGARWPLRRGEALTVLMMMIVATTLPTRRVAVLLGMIVGSVYWATPANQWESLIWPNLTPGLTISDAEGIRVFYEGSFGQVGINWSLWLGPLMRWGLFLLAFHLVIICTMVILRRQWVENEKLAYPVAVVPLAMLEEPEKGRWLGPFFRSGLMWFGFALPFIVGCINSLNHYDAAFVPQIPLHFGQAPLFGGSTYIRFRLSFLLMGLAYFIETRLLLSLVVFFMLAQITRGCLIFLGVSKAAYLGNWTDGMAGGTFAYLMMGAIAVLVGSLLWAARRHLRNVLRGALRPSSVDDSGEIISYRWAVIGLLVGLAIMWGWLCWSGLPWWVAPIVIAVALMIFIALTRLVVQGGMTTLTPVIVPAGFVISTIGSELLGPKGVVALGYTYVWVGGLLMYMMAPVANSLKVCTETRSRMRGLFWAMALAIVISLVASSAFILYLGYRDGAINLHFQYFDWFAKKPGQFAGSILQTPVGPYPQAFPLMALGALIMGLLTLAHYRFLWWPLHPLGFVPCASSIMNSSWLSLCIPLLIKALALRYGGPTMYRRSRPFFAGMILGTVVVGGLWIIIDALTGTVGNSIPMR